MVSNHEFVPYVKVYINLNVRVDKDWRKSEERLRDYGYLQ
jgi:GTPase Era involved in 16S rRNA processing